MLLIGGCLWFAIYDLWFNSAGVGCRRCVYCGLLALLLDLLVVTVLLWLRACCLDG